MFLKCGYLALLLSCGQDAMSQTSTVQRSVNFGLAECLQHCISSTPLISAASLKDWHDDNKSSTQFQITYKTVPIFRAVHRMVVKRAPQPRVPLDVYI